MQELEHSSTSTESETAKLVCVLARDCTHLRYYRTIPTTIKSNKAVCTLHVYVYVYV